MKNDSGSRINSEILKPNTRSSRTAVRKDKIIYKMNTSEMSKIENGSLDEFIM
jgi:hypothetical protein